ncbi:hypothetical protein FHS31_001346 [Sphingomonas vulcanisoli]|uniref:Type II secretion system protein GspC N-terminal domain-containing protein n=1 Tax=Sphingomonas vulcanisoli TaxID=1658060 RepID=A0ABX0TVW5_9SPHN|nr:hypothetical protein [Sphingomonas vulcanisoli]NIJ07736.1 hypothetical protein [Sphingomonas vulcanisoli]
MRAGQAIGLLFLPLLGFAAFENVRGLRSARTERAIAVAAARPTSVVAAEGVAIPAADRGAAERALIKLLGDRAAALGVRLATGIVGAGVQGHSVASELVVTGGEAAVLRFATAIEAGLPTARLSRWTLTPVPEGLRLEGRAVAFWQSGKPAPSPNAIAVAAPGAALSPPTGLFAPATSAKVHGGFPAELIGIVGRIAVDPQAMLRLANGSTRTVAVGETVEGWKLVEISADRVRFRRGVEEKTLVLPTASE